MSIRRLTMPVIRARYKALDTHTPLTTEHWIDHEALTSIDISCPEDLATWQANYLHLLNTHLSAHGGTNPVLPNAYRHSLTTPLFLPATPWESS